MKTLKKINLRSVSETLAHREMKKIVGGNQEEGYGPFNEPGYCCKNNGDCYKDTGCSRPLQCGDNAYCYFPPL